MVMARKTTKPKQLGKPTPIPASPDKALLERVPNPHPETLYAARFTAPEFTCLCPITAQPDFAHLVIDYATVTIGKRLVDLAEPAYLRIGGYWFPRGGMPIDVFWRFGTMPEGLWLPDQGVAPYRGRG